MPYTFILSDETLNRYGYRVLTAGIDLTAFLKNPVMVFAHNTYRAPIGRWENLRIEDGKLLGDAVFDKECEEAQKLEAKVKQGIIKAVSIGFRVLEVSEENVIKGQRRPTVTRAELYEVSLVTVPGNPSAVKLEFPNEGLTLSGDFKEERLDMVLPPLTTEEPKDEDTMNLKELNKKLGLPEGTDADGIAAAFEAQKLRADESAENIVEAGKKLGLINSETIEKAVRKLAETDTGLAVDMMCEGADLENKELDNNGGGNGDQEKGDGKDNSERLSDAVKKLAAQTGKDGGEEKGQDAPQVEFLTFDKALTQIQERNGQ